MIAPDSSVLVAGFVPNHAFHDIAVDELVEVRERGALIAHTIAETFSVLSASSGIYRAAPPIVNAYLRQFIGAGEPISISASAYGEALSLLTDHGRGGGVIYDALIALAARDANATLVSFDRRAEATYELCGAEARVLPED